MARSSLADVISLGDPALTWNFDLFIPTIPGSADSRHITFRCQSVDLPGVQLESVNAELHGTSVPYASRLQYTQTLNLTLMETSDFAARTAINRWIQTARSWRSNSGSPFSLYAVTALIVCYDNIPQPTATTQINYMWPENLQDVTLSGDSGDIIRPQITMRYTDWFFV